MSKQDKTNPLNTILTSVLVSSLGIIGVANANDNNEENLFIMDEVHDSQMFAGGHKEGGCGGDKEGGDEGSCGGDEGSCGGDA